MTAAPVYDAHLLPMMAILFHRLLAPLAAMIRPGIHRLPGYGFVALLAVPLGLPPPAHAAVVYLPELCKLSIETLLRVRVIDDSSRNLPLIDLPLEKLLTIEAIRLTHNGQSAEPVMGTFAEPQGATTD